MSITKIPDVFKDDDTVYHYTTLVNLFCILKTMKLRMSSRNSSRDPIENAKSFVSYSGDNNDELMKIGRRISCELKNVKQLSFCKNRSYDLRKGTPMVFPFENYGFAKPRMWDNYGDKYQGGCLVFSKKKLKEAIKKTEFFDNGKHDVEYMSYNDFSKKHHSMVWRNSAKETYQFYLQEFKRSLFYKHLDYEMENEYRICSLSYSDDDCIDIKDSVIGIIVSDFGKKQNQCLFEENEKQLKEFNKNLPYLIISFDNKTIRLI